MMEMATSDPQHWGLHSTNPHISFPKKQQSLKAEQGKLHVRHLQNTKCAPVIESLNLLPIVNSHWGSNCIRDIEIDESAVTAMKIILEQTLQQRRLNLIPPQNIKTGYNNKMEYIKRGSHWGITQNKNSSFDDASLETMKELIDNHLQPEDWKYMKESHSIKSDINIITTPNNSYEHWGLFPYTSTDKYFGKSTQKNQKHWGLIETRSNLFFPVKQPKLKLEQNKYNNFQTKLHSKKLTISKDFQTKLEKHWGISTIDNLNFNLSSISKRVFHKPKHTGLVHLDNISNLRTQMKSYIDNIITQAFLKLKIIEVKKNLILII
jgi:hypothetical protein